MRMIHASPFRPSTTITSRAFAAKSARFQTPTLPSGLPLIVVYWRRRCEMLSNENDKQAALQTASTTAPSAPVPGQKATERMDWEAWYAQLQKSDHWDQARG